MLGFNGYEKQIQTGDVCLFSRNDLRGFLMRCTMRTKWCHVGIAVRLRDGKITKDKGDLYVLDIMSGKRYDDFENKIVKGFGLSRIEDCIKKYNYGAFRRLKNYDGVDTKIREFHKEHVGSLFQDDKFSFIKLWLQTTIYKNDTKKKFCTQIASTFYRELSGMCHKEIFCNSEEFIIDDLITPKMFSYEHSSKSKLFEDEEEKLFYYRKSDIKSVIVGPLAVFFTLLILITIILIIFIYYPVLEKKLG